MPPTSSSCNREPLQPSQHTHTPKLSSTATRSKYHMPRIRVAFVACTLLLSLSSTVLAQHEPHPALITTPVVVHSPSDILATDDRPAPTPTMEFLIPTDRAAHQLRFNRRAADSSSSSKTDDNAKSSTDKSGSKSDSKTESKSESKTESKTGSAATTTNTSTTTSSSTPTSDAPDKPLPSALDNTVASDFQIPGDGSTNSCPTFMRDLLSNPTFKTCYPLSMLLLTSDGFFDAQRHSLVRTVRVLDATCKADVKSCTQFLSTAAKNLTADANCKKELNSNISMVTKTYEGLSGYSMVFASSCIRDPATDSYCFANATASANAFSSYLYFMAYGNAYPASAVPTCSWCTKATMAVFHAGSADRKQAVTSVYTDAARQVNTFCGPSFVNSTIALASSGMINLPLSYSTLATTVFVAGLTILYGL